MAQNLHEFLLRLKALFRKRRMEREMADELAFHQAMLQDKLLRQGLRWQIWMQKLDGALAAQAGGTKDCASCGNLAAWRTLDAT